MKERYFSSLGEAMGAVDQGSYTYGEEYGPAANYPEAPVDSTIVTGEVASASNLSLKQLFTNKALVVSIVLALGLWLVLQSRKSEA